MVIFCLNNTIFWVLFHNKNIHMKHYWKRKLKICKIKIFSNLSDICYFFNYAFCVFFMSRQELYAYCFLFPTKAIFEGWNGSAYCPFLSTQDQKIKSMPCQIFKFYEMTINKKQRIQVDIGRYRLCFTGKYDELVEFSVSYHAPLHEKQVLRIQGPRGDL